jgi:hypothetical protein
MFETIRYISSCCYVVHVNGVRLCLRTAATNEPTVYLPDDIWVWTATVEWYWQGKTKNWEKFCPSATLSTTISTWTDLGANSGLRCERLTVWALAWPTFSLLRLFHFYGVTIFKRLLIVPQFLLFSFFPSEGGVGQNQEWMPALFANILLTPHMIWVWRATVEWYIDRGKTEKLGEKPVPVPLCPPQISHGLTRELPEPPRWEGGD